MDSTVRKGLYEGGTRTRGMMRFSAPGRPLVTVVTVVLNRVTDLERTVASVRNQSYDNVEYIVIDGGSVDGTVELLSKLGASIDYWVSEQDNGIAAAFNKGIALARGELIGLLNAGDVYETGAVKKVVDAFVSSPSMDVICGGIRLTEGNSPAILCFSEPARLDKETSVYHPTVFVRRSAYERHGPFDESYRFAMDYELLLRFKRRGSAFAALPEVLAEMKLGGVSVQHWRQGLEEVRRARKLYFSSADVAARHLSALLLNLGARGLKRLWMGGLYRAYWKIRSMRATFEERERPPK